MYDQGEGVPQDDKAAAHWYRRAAEQGHAKAQLNLGGMYYEGKGVPKDYVYAHMWVSIAISNGTSKEHKHRKDLNLSEKKMTLSQIAEAQKLARECVRKAYKNCEY